MHSLGEVNTLPPLAGEGGDGGRGGASRRRGGKISPGQLRVGGNVGDLEDGMKVAALERQLRRPLAAAFNRAAGITTWAATELSTQNRMVYGQEEPTMSHTLRKAMGFALSGLLLMAPIGMAAGTATEKSPATPSPQMQQPTTNTPSVQTADRIAATVEGVDQSKGMLKLRSAEGDRMEFKVPKSLLAGLHEGDRVQVAIQKAPGTPERSPLGSTERPRPEQPK